MPEGGRRVRGILKSRGGILPPFLDFSTAGQIPAAKIGPECQLGLSTVTLVKEDDLKDYFRDIEDESTIEKYNPGLPK